MTSASRVLLVGWDAADWKIIHPLLDRGFMPHTRRLVENGVMAHLATLTPVLSPMLWTSIATGKRPFRHGVLGFTEPAPDGSGVQPVTTFSRRTKAIWNILGQNGKRSIVVGWWPSHPAEPIDGVMVSNHYQAIRGPRDQGWPLLPGAVHPPRLVETLADLRVHPEDLSPEHILPFVPFGAEVDQEKDRRIASVIKILSECSSVHSAATHLMETEPWDFMAVYYDAIDHFCHGFMRYHPPRRSFVSEDDFRIYNNVVSAGYVYHDLMLGRLLELAGDDTTVLLVSDHGFHPDHLRPSHIPAEPAGPAAEHRDLGILAMSGPGIRRDELVHGASLLDITPTVLALFGLPAGEDMDGRPLLEAFEEPGEVRTIPSWDEVAGDDGRHPPGTRADAAESRELLEHLIALGYIERPPDNRELAVRKTRTELDYNLARAYMDAGMHGEAAPLLAGLYERNPLEFRFGIKLAVCLRALDATEEMVRVVEGLYGRWRLAAERARARLGEIAGIARERRDRVRRQGGGERRAESLFSTAERTVIRNLRAIARGNESTLDLLLASAAVSAKDVNRALRHLERARESNSRVPGYHVQVGDTLLAAKRPADALESYRRALELDAHHAPAVLGVCRTHLARREYEPALEAASEAVGLKFHSPPGHHFRGVALERLKRPEEAVAAFTEALRQNPNFPEAHTALARVLSRQLDDPEGAQEHRRAAARIRRERRRQKRRREVPEIPLLSDHSIDEHLPDLPEPRRSIRTPLGAGPGDTPSDRAAGDPVTVVSGLPRSGTSMAMQMLAAGGMELHTDGERPPDESNPRGYLEHKKVMRLAEENDWLDECAGRAVKVVVPLVPYLPRDTAYRVVLLERDIDEVLASQKAMLARLGQEVPDPPNERLGPSLERQLSQVKGLLAAHGVPVLELRHREILDAPREAARRLAAFLDADLDTLAMAAVVDPELYRERG